MGTNTSSLKALNEIDRQRWKAIPGCPNAFTDGDRQVQSSIVTLRPNSSFALELPLFDERRNFQGSILKCYGAQLAVKPKRNLFQEDREVEVLTERIVRRWEDMPQLTFPETLYTLKQTLKGYQILFHKAGLFEVNESMFGINHLGQIKVWFNQNFGDNHPSREKRWLAALSPRDEQKGLQQKLVLNVIQVVEEKCEQGRYPADFRKLMKSAMSFPACQLAVRNYISEKRIIVPDKINVGIGP